LDNNCLENIAAHCEKTAPNGEQTTQDCEKTAENGAKKAEKARKTPEKRRKMPENLEILSLNNNRISDLKGTCDEISAHFPKLRHLSLLKNGCCPNFFNGNDEDDYMRYRSVFGDFRGVFMLFFGFWRRFG
jgi:hypothetical protein